MLFEYASDSTQGEVSVLAETGDEEGVYAYGEFCFLQRLHGSPFSAPMQRIYDDREAQNTVRPPREDEDRQTLAARQTVHALGEWTARFVSDTTYICAGLTAGGERKGLLCTSYDRRLRSLLLVGRRSRRLGEIHTGEPEGRTATLAVMKRPLGSYESTFIKQDGRDQH